MGTESRKKGWAFQKGSPGSKPLYCHCWEGWLDNNGDITPLKRKAYLPGENLQYPITTGALRLIGPWPTSKRTAWAALVKENRCPRCLLSEIKVLLCEMTVLFQHNLAGTWDAHMRAAAFGFFSLSWILPKTAVNMSYSSHVEIVWVFHSFGNEKKKGNKKRKDSFCAWAGYVVVIFRARNPLVGTSVDSSVASECIWVHCQSQAIAGSFVEPTACTLATQPPPAGRPQQRGFYPAMNNAVPLKWCLEIGFT